MEDAGAQGVRATPACTHCRGGANGGVAWRRAYAMRTWGVRVRRGPTLSVVRSVASAREHALLMQVLPLRLHELACRVCLSQPCSLRLVHPARLLWGMRQASPPI